MKKAFTVPDIPNVFKATPLTGADMAEFYEDTMTVRTAAKARS